ncbi:hypothetical protein JL722_14587 [Aureococcus anophagefferens]|nr:hypothetical protein JL722_14587 [Aureococcus anophagefferens]
MNPATLLWLPDDLAHLIIEHVDGFDLARLSQTCGRCLAAHADEKAWESVVRARWFDRRWLGQRRGLTRAASAVSVRQTRREAVCFDPARIAVTWLACVDEAGRVAPVPCEILFAEIFARGHERRDARRRQAGRWRLTWAAAIVRVAVPDCYYEGDFLERAVELRVPFVETGARATLWRASRLLLETGRGAAALTMPFVGPEHVHRWYTELPGGCVVLATGL